MHRSLYVPLSVVLSLVGCGFHSSGDDLMDPANVGTGVPIDASSGSGGTAGTSGSGGTAGTSGGAGIGGAGGTSGSAGVGGTAGTGGTGTGGTGTGGTGGTGGPGTGGTGGTGGSSGTGGGPAGAGGTVTVDAGEDADNPEDCGNGLDDNADGLIDCADPLCEPGYVCLPKPPDGWSEPGYVAEGAPSSQAFDCEDLTTFGKTLFGGLIPEPAQCPCGCGIPQGGQCQASGVLWKDPSCAGDTATTTQQCQGIPASWRIASIQTHEVAPAVPGACAVVVQTNVPPPKWTVKATLCLSSSVGGGCGQNAVCVPRPPDGADAHACVASAGNKACVADYAEKRVYHEGVDDTRACAIGGCWCGDASGQSCAGAYELYSDVSCQQSLFSATIDGQCHDTGLAVGAARSHRIVIDGIVGGQCPPQGNGAPSGAVLPVSPHTVCCVSAAVP